MPGISRNLGLHDFERRYALSLHGVYCREMSGRVFAAFSDIESEANVFAQATYEDLMGQPDPIGSGDVAACAEIAQGRAEARYQDLVFVQNRVVEAAITGLYHLWERRVRSWMIRDGGELGFTNNDKRIAASGDFQSLCGLLTRHGWDVQSQAFYSRLDQLHHAANTIKHGEGRSSQTLFEMRRDLFWPYSVLGDCDVARCIDGPHRTLSLNTGHFEEFASAIEAFWHSVPDIADDDGRCA